MRLHGDISRTIITRMGSINSLEKISGYYRKDAPHQYGTSIGLLSLCRHIDKIGNFDILEVDVI